MVYCLVKSCKSRGRINGITYHRFPKECPEKWLEPLNISSCDLISIYHNVCSLHFKSDDFKYGKSGKRVFLKEGAVPSLNLDGICNVNVNLVSTKDVDPLTNYDKLDQEFLNSQESTLSLPENRIFIPEVNNTNFVDESDTYCTKNVNNGVQKREQIFLPEHTNKDNSDDSAEKQDAHNYSVIPNKRKLLALKQMKLLIKKDLKAAQQKNRRLERRVVHLKKTLENLKEKS